MKLINTENQELPTFGRPRPLSVKVGNYFNWCDASCNVGAIIILIGVISSGLLHSFGS